MSYLSIFFRLSILSSFVFLISSCATQEIMLDAVWENENYESRTFRKVAVFGMAKQKDNKKAFEDDAVKYFKSQGIPAIAGYELFEHEPDVAEMSQSDIKEHLYGLGVDGVLTAAAIENISEDDEDITDEELEAHSEGVYKFGQYFVKRYDRLQSDVDHEHQKYAILEANFYYLRDYNKFDGSALIWISHFKYGENENTDVKMEIDKYAKIVVKSLFEDQVILPRK